jgi:(p)ppGpp synthase/HD superfamily hydrolase
MTKVQGPINHKAVIAHCYADKVYKQALELSKKLYKKDKRKHTGIDYLSHPLTVASLLLEVGVSRDAMVVSALQDTLSRTALKESTIRTEFGDTVADQVVALTPVKASTGELDLDAYKAKLAGLDADFQTVKLAAILDDVCAIPAAKLAAESELINTSVELAGVLTAGNAELARRVQAALRRARA